jgi:hypothetical protein
VIPKSVLEVGASNGYRLNRVKNKFGCSCTVLKPSLEAIKNGKIEYPDIHFYCGCVNNMPFEEK